MKLISVLNLNALSTRLVTKRREADKRLTGETVSDSGVRTITQVRTVTPSAAFKIAMKSPITGALMSLLTCVTLPSSVARNPPPGCDPECPSISFTAVEVVDTPTKAARTDEEGVWPFGPTEDPVATFDIGASGDVTKKETGGSAYVQERASSY